MHDVAVLSTGAAAELCRVDRKTVARWIDAGLLVGHRTGGGRRRVLRKDLLAFMADRGMPLPSRPVSSPRIAVIDDEVAVAVALARLIRLQLPEAEVCVAHDGFAAGVLLCTLRPHLVFLDVVLPGLTGVDVCRFARSSPELADVPIVVFSGHLDDELTGQLLASGASRVISKPLAANDVRAVLRDYLGHQIPASATEGAE